MREQHHHTAAVHLLEAGAEVNVIRGLLGHVRVETTNHYAQIMLRTKLAAMQLCEIPSETSGGSRRRSGWKEDQKLLAWLNVPYAVMCPGSPTPS